MKKTHSILTVQVVLTLLVIALCSSCVTQKQVKYLQSQSEQDTANSFKMNYGPDYKLQPRDNLYIRIFSLDEKTYSFFNKASASNYNDFVSDASIYLNSYNVAEDGNVDFPIIGKVYVQGLTVTQAKDLLQRFVDEYLKETMVVVKLVNFNLTILGEVKKPGQFKIYQDKVNIFEAISMAGDLTDFADKGRIALVRQSKDGSKVTYIDLNSKNILNSEYFTLRPNDIVYVAPLGIKRWGFETFPWVLTLTAITTALLLLNYFK